MFSGVSNERLEAIIGRIMPLVVEIRRRLHSNPELGFAEYQTSAVVRQYLVELELDVRVPGDKTGAIALLTGGKPGPVIGLRADIDALPIQEATRLPFESRNPGVMHACGHDGHMAMLLGTAMVLRELTQEVPGTVAFIFQPAEELLKGAKMMIEGHILEYAPFNFIYAFHLWPALPLGHVGVKPGVAMASAAKFRASFSGSGGQGPNPVLACDAVVAAAYWFTLLQNFGSRKVDPTEPAVVSVGRIEGGSSYNTIARSVAVEGTVRTVSPRTRERMPQWLEELLESVASPAGLSYELHYEELCPPLMNDPQQSELVLRLAENLFGPERVHQLTQPSMVAEDFAYFLEQAPGCMIFLGIGEPERANALHTDTFTFDEEVHFQRIKLLVSLVLSKG